MTVCEVCKKTELEVQLVLCLMTVGDDRRKGNVCVEDARPFKKLAARLPKVRQRQSFDSLIREDPDPQNPPESS